MEPGCLGVDRHVVSATWSSVAVTHRERLPKGLPGPDVNSPCPRQALPRLGAIFGDPRNDPLQLVSLLACRQ